MSCEANEFCVLYPNSSPLQNNLSTGLLLLWYVQEPQLLIPHSDVEDHWTLIKKLLFLFLQLSFSEEVHADLLALHPANFTLLIQS